VCQSQFNKGLYVFEDTFEHWRNTEFESNEMVSATWMDIVNAYPDRQCGVGQSFGGRESLRFGGPNQRLAETADMDLSTGGALEFELFIPPLGYDIENEFCKTGFQGNIFVEFSTNHGANWTQLMEYEPAVYRADHFFPVSLVLPGDGHSNTTRFRFEQRNFEAPRDNWALDNVRVLKYLPRGWHSDDGFQRSKREAQSVIQEAQCCLDTDWCEKRYSVDQFRRICSKFDWYKGIQFQLRLSEMLLLVAVVINLVKFVYVSIQDWLMKSRYPFQDEVNELLSLGYVDSMMKRIPLRYRLKKLIPDEYTNNIHRSARMEQAMRDQFADEEGKGDLQQSRESIESERRKAEKRIEKMRKRIERRKAKKNFKGSDSLEEMLQLELEETLKLNELQAYQKPKEGGFSGGGQDEARLDFSFEEGVGTDLDTFQRQNHALLRVPFNIEHDPFWRHSFGAAAIALFVVLFSVQVGLTTDYTVTEEVVPYGNSLLKGAVVLTAGLQLIFAAYCDAKEIWHAIKHVVPLRDKWIPQVTLDLSDEGRALIVGHNIVPIGKLVMASSLSGWTHAIIHPPTCSVIHPLPTHCPTASSPIHHLLHHHPSITYYSRHQGVLSLLRALRSILRGGLWSGRIPVVCVRPAAAVRLLEVLQHAHRHARTGTGRHHARCPGSWVRPEDRLVAVVLLRAELRDERADRGVLPDREHKEHRAEHCSRADAVRADYSAHRRVQLASCCHRLRDRRRCHLRSFHRS